MAYTILKCGTDYFRHLRRKGKAVERAAYAYRLLWNLLDDPAFQVEALKRVHFEQYADKRTSAGINPLTVRAELTRIMAGIRLAKKHELIATVPSCDMPDGPYAKRRPLTEDEYAKVMQQPMSERLRRFYTLAYWTGARSQAAEQLEWSWGVDLERGIIDFNPPERRRTPTKRRVDCFPIGAELRAELVAWRAVSPLDAYVIGVGPAGRCTSTYHEAAYVVRKLAKLTDPTLVPRHCLRKMFATELFNKGANPEFVGELMGDNPDVLRKHYAIINATRLRETANLRGTQQ